MCLFLANLVCVRMSVCMSMWVWVSEWVSLSEWMSATVNTHTFASNITNHNRETYNNDTNIDGMWTSVRAWANQEIVYDHKTLKAPKKSNSSYININDDDDDNNNKIVVKKIIIKTQRVKCFGVLNVCMSIDLSQCVSVFQMKCWFNVCARLR